jgi:hypothetical protein
LCHAVELVPRRGACATPWSLCHAVDLAVEEAPVPVHELVGAG